VNRREGFLDEATDASGRFAALARTADPRGGVRSFSRQDRRNSIRSIEDGMWVARLTTTS
jgi:hypothetical protein